MDINRSQVYKYFHANAKDLISQYLQPDRQGKGWICPLCGNGSGEDGDGLVYNPNAKSEGHFHCFVCGFDGDLIDLIGQENGITDRKEMQEIACKVFGLEIKEDPNPALEPIDFIAYEKKYNLEHKEPARPPEPKTQESEEKEVPPQSQSQPARPLPEVPEFQTPRNDRKEKVLKALKESLEGKNGEFSELFKTAHNDLKTPAAVEYIKARGLTAGNPFLKYMGYLENKYIGKRYFKGCIAFFGSNASYTVRDVNYIDPEAKLEKSMKPKGAVDVPIGLLDVIKAKDKTIEGTGVLEPVFIVEGLFDAPSIAEAGGDAIALNGTGNLEPIIWAFKEWDIKRPLILALDNDGAGQNAQQTAVKKLEKAGLEYTEASLSASDPDVKDANDFLRYDRKEFIKAIQHYRHLSLKDFEATLNRSKKRRIEAQLTEKVKYPGIKTGFGTLDGNRFLDGGLYSGLYILGAVSSLGKTTFTLQLADQIAKSGQDVIFFSLEMPELEIISKSISRYTLKSLFDSGEVTPGEKPDARAKTLHDIYRNYVTDRDGTIKPALDNYFKDTGDHLRIIEGLGDVNAQKIREEIDKHVKATGRAPVMFIDYLQLLTQPSDIKHAMTDKQITDANVFELKRISRDYNIPIFIISSFNRDNYNESVNMRSFKESGAIEYCSDILIGLEPEYMGIEDNTKDKHLKKNGRKKYESREEETGIRSIRLVMLKNRNGRAGGVDLFDYYPMYNCYVEKGNAETIEDFSNVYPEF